MSEQLIERATYARKQLRAAYKRASETARNGRWVHTRERAAAKAEAYKVALKWVERI